MLKIALIGPTLIHGEKRIYETFDVREVISEALAGKRYWKAGDAERAALAALDEAEKILREGSKRLT